MIKIFLIFFILFFSSCSPFYVMRAAFEESKILLKRKKISNLISNPEIDAETKRKLLLVSEARKFAIEIGLTPKKSYTLYSDLGRDVASWILLGSKKDSFSLYTWWFPIVGNVPYKGFFEKKDAEKLAKKLEKKGFETWLRDTDAFSTLGWFNDPILSTTLKKEDFQLVNTVIHEIFHSTIWIKDQVTFNESIANFVGLEGAIQFYKKLTKFCKDSELSKNKELCSTNYNLEKNLAYAKISKNNTLKLEQIINKLYDELNTLYTSNKSESEKMIERDLVFKNNLKEFWEKNPTVDILRTLNNAEIMQLKIYLTEINLFEEVFKKTKSNWSIFLEIIKKLEDSEVDAFQNLKEFQNGQS